MGSAISGELRYLADGPQGRRAVGRRVRRPLGGAWLQVRAQVASAGI